MMIARPNPFQPGTGTKPAYIVGRSKERKSIEGAFRSILADRDDTGRVPHTSPPQVIVGPRGVGKTVLSQLMMERASNLGIHTVELDKSLLTGPEENLRKAITPPSRLDGFLGYLERFKGAVRVSELFNFELGPSGNRVPMDLNATMAAGAIAGPMAIFLDEAHTVPPEKMQVFCRAAQSLISKRCPLVLVLAGTPGLLSLLMNMGGTFMERARRLRFNLFTFEETQEALSKGFEGTGHKIESDALQSLASWSDRYPYFIQLAGHWTWEEAEDVEAKNVTLELAKSGLKLAGEERRDFYNTRRSELFNHGVLKEAIQMIELMANAPEGVDRVELLENFIRANEGMDMDEALEVERKLVNLGFIYEGRDTMVAGIPSLFDFIKSKPGMK